MVRKVFYTDHITFDNAVVLRVLLSKTPKSGTLAYSSGLWLMHNFSNNQELGTTPAYLKNVPCTLLRELPQSLLRGTRFRSDRSYTTSSTFFTFMQSSSLALSF